MFPFQFPLQNGTAYEIWLSRDDGTRLALLDNVATFAYTRGLNTVGTFSLVLPQAFDNTLLAYDRRITIWRKPVGGSMYIDFQGFIRKLEPVTDRAGNLIRLVEGYSLEYLLSGRAVAYLSGSAQADQTDQADDMLKVLARQNIGATATDTTRTLSATYLSVAADLALGPSLTKSFSYSNMLTAMRDIANSARQAGTEVYFQIVPTSESAFEFRTYTGTLGTDRTSATSGGPIFGLEYGNLFMPHLTQDATNEVNYAYGLGQGQAANRNVQTASDTTRTGRSAFGRREGTINANMATANATVTAAAQAAVIAGRPLATFTGRLTSQTGSVYGLDWGFGDRLTITYDKLQFSALVRSVSVTVDGNGLETVDTQLEAYL